MTRDKDTILPEVADDVVYRRVSEGAVLLSTGEEVYYGLNETGARAWRALDAVETFGELCSRIEETFPSVDRGAIADDLAALLDDLERHGLLVGPRAAAGREDG